jgi:long-chain acyl-CoA synthetase
VIVWRGSEGSIRWEEWIERFEPTPPSLAETPQPNLLFTSGTTGVPKAVLRPFHLPANIEGYLRQTGASAMATYKSHLVVGPLYHTGPRSALDLFLAGVLLVVPGRFDPEEALAAIDHHGIETTVMVPTHFIRLLALPEEVRSQYELHTLKRVGHTGSMCPVEVKRAMIDWLGPILQEGYGATEVGTLASITSQEWLVRPGSVGQAIPPFEVLVLDDEGLPLPANTPGRLCFRDGAGRGVQYLDTGGAGNDLEVRPGLFTIGEVGYVDAEGYIYICDRAADMIVSGGVNIYPFDCERVLLSHPQVVDAAVYGVPDPEMVEKAVGAVVLRDSDVTGEELVAYCRDKIAHYKVPREIGVVDSLPRTDMGKINKRRLRDLYEAAEG